MSIQTEDVFLLFSFSWHVKNFIIHDTMKFLLLSIFEDCLFPICQIITFKILFFVIIIKDA